MPRRTYRFALLAEVLLLVGCSVPVMPASPSASTSAIAETPRVAIGALLSIAASGAIPGSSPYGCLASLLIDLGSGPTDRIASWDDARFALDRPGPGSECVVSGPAIGGPTSLAPGHYRVAGVGSIVSDVASPGFSQMPILGTTVRCDRDILVLPETTGIAIHVTFGDGSCTIDVTTR
jgi:hypothetical protein